MLLIKFIINTIKKIVFLQQLMKILANFAPLKTLKIKYNLLKITVTVLRSNFLCFYVRNYNLVQFVIYFILVLLTSKIFASNYTECTSSAEADTAAETTVNFYKIIGIYYIADLLISNPNIQDQTTPLALSSVDNHTFLDPNLSEESDNSDTKSDNSDTKSKDSDTESNDSDTDPLTKYSAKIIFNLFKLALQNCETDEDIFEKSMEFMSTKFPNDLFAKTEVETKNPLANINVFQEKATQELIFASQEEFYQFLYFRSAITAYNVGLITNTLDEIEKIEETYNFVLELFISEKE